MGQCKIISLNKRVTSGHISFAHENKQKASYIIELCFNEFRYACYLRNVPLECVLLFDQILLAVLNAFYFPLFEIP